MSDLLIERGHLGDRQVDVRIRNGTVAEVGPGLRREGERVLDGRGRHLLPGLHDHHLHLTALAAALASVPCGPPAIRDAHGLARALTQTPAHEWVRGTGYHESVAGDLDRHRLDALVGARPVRVQHRSGVLWVLSSAALERSGLASSQEPGVERGPDGRATGRLWRADALLRRSVSSALPDLGAVGRLLASYGITGVTDATPQLGPAGTAVLRAATADGRVPQQLTLLGAPLDQKGPGIGPYKLVLNEAAGLDLEAFRDDVQRARAAGRGVAVHCVTRAEAVVAITGLDEAGGTRGDRLEHGSVLPPECDQQLRRLSLTVVTQPNFVAERGDDYAREVDADDLPDLYRCGTLLARGIAVAAGTDAPYGSADPWAAMAAAVHRRTPTGRVLGVRERLAESAALRLFLGSAERPGGPARAIRPGQPGDVVVLSVPPREAVAAGSAACVVATVRGGELLHLAEGGGPTAAAPPATGRA